MTAQLLRFSLLFLGAVPVWLILRRPWKRRIPREIALGLFVAYLTALLIMALEGSWASPAAMLRSARERLASMDRIHLIPLTTISRQVRALPSEDALTQLLGNTLLFAPWGFFLPLLWTRFRSVKWALLYSIGLTLFIECTQLFIDRFCEVDDLILNCVGSLTGAGIWLLCRRLFPALEALSDHSPDAPGRS